MKNTPDFTALASEYVDLAARAEQLHERMDAIKLEFATGLSIGRHDLAGIKVTVSPNRRLDAKKFVENFPVTEFPAYYKTAPDTTAIKKDIGENAYVGYCIEGKPRVSVS